MEMADPPRNPDSGGDTGVESGRGPIAGASRWQKVIGIIGLLVILWVGNRMLSTLLGRGHGPGGMRHGPGQHAPPARMHEQESDTRGGIGHEPR
jgi:hypothetical protein